MFNFYAASSLAPAFAGVTGNWGSNSNAFMQKMAGVSPGQVLQGVIR